ncbi:MAG: TonB family protein [Candidatus Sulfotelmatobacter sp.]
MAHHSMFDPDPANPASPAAEGRVEKARISPPEDAADRLDLAELAAKFTVHGGGRVSPEVSADLALDIVLNEIAEQACLATPASGAAIVLKRDGEWVCRASAGGNSPSLGARLDAEGGLSGACIRTRQLQRCDDAQSDPRADVEACRSLDVRSVIIVPLLQDGDLVGIFEVFSSHASAFGGRDERTLEVLSQRVLTILKQVSEPPATFPKVAEVGEESLENSSAGNSIVEAPIMGNSVAENTKDKAEEYALFDTGLAPRASSADTGREARIFTWILGAAVLAFALLLTVSLGQRLMGRKSARRERPPVVSSSSSSSSSSSRVEHGSTVVATKAGETTPPLGPGTQSPGSVPSDVSHSGSVSEATKNNGDPVTTYHSPPAGSLLVYEKGKEIFRMPPEANQAERITRASTARSGSTNGSGTAGRSVSRNEQAGIYELSPEAAENSLLHRVEPDYPEAARAQQIQGPVVLDVHIGRDGAVLEVKLVSGQALLADAAIAAVKQWKFQPRQVQGNTLEMQTRVTLNFRLPRS